MSDQTRADLDAAIRAHAIDEWEGDLVADWVLTAALIDETGGSNIGVEVSRQPMPNYITVGLLSEALRVSDPDYGDE